MERRQSTSTLTKSMMAAVATLLLILVVSVSSSSATMTTTTTTILTVAPNAAFVVPHPRALTRHRRASATANHHPLASVARPETSSSSSDGALSKTVGEESSPGNPRSGDASTPGPRGAAAGRRRPDRRRGGSTSGPRGTATERRKSPSTTRKRAPHQFDHKTETAWSRTDKTASELVAMQDPNEDSPPMIWLPSSSNDDGGCRRGDRIEHPHLMTVSLDDLFPNLGFSDLFASSKSFRDEIRNSMREDVFDTTPAYANMSDKARRMLLLPDSSLQGSWRFRKDDADHDDSEGPQIRMKELTRTLSRHLGEGAPTGDEFMEKIGSLCGSNPRTHWIDIVGLTDRVVPHSWHQDTGRLPSSPEGGDADHDQDSRTVLLGFPPCDEYDGTGVFSHVVKLDGERIAPDGHPVGEPVLFGGEVDDEFVVRPRFARGREIVAYRDVDVLHSAPDVAHRTSVMRFM